MEEHPNVKLVREGYQAFIAGDMEWLNQHMHENIVWHQPGNNAYAGDYHGREQVLGMLAQSVQQVVPEFDIHDVVANDDHAIAMLNVDSRRTDNGETLQTRAIQVFHLDAEGRALESWILNEDQAAVDKFMEGLSR